MSTIIISFLLILIVYKIIRSLVKNKHDGCGDSCNGCNACSHGKDLHQEFRKDHPNI